MAYGGEGCKEQAASDALSGMGGQKGWKQALAFATATIRRRSDLRVLHDSHVSDHMAIDRLAGDYQRRVEEALMAIP